MNKLSLLLITLFCITCSFFIGYLFWSSLWAKELEDIQQSLQVTLHLHGKTLDVEKSHSNIRVIVDGKVLSQSGSIELKKE